MKSVRKIRILCCFLTALIGLAFVAVGGAAGCARDGKFQHYIERDVVAVGGGYELSIPAGWEGIVETASGAEPDIGLTPISLYGPGGKRADVWRSTLAESQQDVAREARRIAEGESEARIVTSEVDGATVQVVIDAEQDGTNKSLLFIYIKEDNASVGIQVFGNSDVDKMVASETPGSELVAFILKEIGLRRIPPDTE